MIQMLNSMSVDMSHSHSQLGLGNNIHVYDLCTIVVYCSTVLGSF